MAEKKATVKDGYVTIKLPRVKNEDALYVEVNFKGYYIQRGVNVDVPEAVAEAIENSQNAEELAIIEAEKKEQEYLKKASNPFA